MCEEIESGLRARASPKPLSAIGGAGGGDCVLCLVTSRSTSYVRAHLQQRTISFICQPCSLSASFSRVRYPRLHSDFGKSLIYNICEDIEAMANHRIMEEGRSLTAYESEGDIMEAGCV